MRNFAYHARMYKRYTRSVFFIIHASDAARIVLDFASYRADSHQPLTHYEVFFRRKFRPKSLSTISMVVFNTTIYCFMTRFCIALVMAPDEYCRQTYTIQSVILDIGHRLGLCIQPAHSSCFLHRNRH